MIESYRNSHTQPGKGLEYHTRFIESPYRKMIWGFEKHLLDRICAELLASKKIRMLDFACGTGRITNYLATKVDFVAGVDISEVMLAIARKNLQDNVEIIEGDITQEPVLADRKFNLITAFRFFPNAEPELREQVMSVLVNHLEHGAYFVFNNHKNISSTRNLIARALGRRNFRGMSEKEVIELTSKHGFTFERAYGLSIFPSSELRPLLPVRVLRFIDNLLQNIPGLSRFGENRIYVCRFSKSSLH